MKQPKPVVYRIARKAAEPALLKDAIALPGLGLTFSVRVAKAKLSALLDLVASGQEVVITSDGTPKAVLVSAAKRSQRRVFTGTLGALQGLPVQTEGPFAEGIIRQDRDGRGW